MKAIITRFTVIAGKEAEFEATMRTLAQTTLAEEPGTLVYRLFKSPQVAGDYVLLENYVSQAAIDLHMQTDYLRAAGPAVHACLAIPPTLEFLDGV